MGALAIRHHIMDSSELPTNSGRLGKQESTDIDFTSYRKFANPWERFVTSRLALSKSKSTCWKMRAKAGTKKKWYTDVDALSQ